MKKIFMITFGCLQFCTAQSTIKTMFYNVLNYPTAPPSNREEVLATIIDAYEPDIFMICELETARAGEKILTTALNDDHDTYASAPFLSNISNPVIESHQLLYFNHQKFTLIQHQRIPTRIRDINWYTLELIADTPISIQVFVAHLKASQGADNETKRLEMVNSFVDNLSTLNENDYIIFAGDFNIYYSDEPAYQKLLDTNNKITMVDPINTLGNWHNNSTFTNIHTQSTRIDTSEFDNTGSSGGLDDRFDFILISENMKTNPQLRYIPDTYKSFGNNGNCYNNRIDATNCRGTYNNTLRDALYKMSDHLPVVMELETNTTLLDISEFVDNTKTIQLTKGNIVQDELYLQNFKTSTPIDFKIYNTLGQEMKSFSSNNTVHMKISVSNLSDGIYYLIPTHIKTNSNPIKFIKRN